jgi:hypothetical protein
LSWDADAFSGGSGYTTAAVTAAVAIHHDALPRRGILHKSQIQQLLPSTFVDV